MSNTAFLNMLGLCMRAGKLVRGEDACKQAIRAGKAYLTVIDASASANAKKSLGDSCATYHVPLLEAEMLGGAIGRGSHKAAVVTDAGFAKALMTKYTTNDQPPVREDGQSK